MSDGNKDLLSNLILISKIDSNLARIAAERKKIEIELAQKQAQRRKAENDHAALADVLADKKKRYEKEEKRIKEEREKLVERRKALSSLSNYKLQQSAVKEIEHSAKDIDVWEGGILSLVDEADQVSIELGKLAQVLEQAHAAFVLAEKEANETFTNFERRIAEYQQQREQLSPQLDPVALSTYQKVMERYPSNAVVPLNKDACTGCFMALGPQVKVQILRGDSLVKCRSCGRIVYIEESKEE